MSFPRPTPSPVPLLTCGVDHLAVTRAVIRVSEKLTLSRSFQNPVAPPDCVVLEKLVWSRFFADHASVVSGLGSIMEIY